MNLKQSILSTLAFYDIFDHPLRLEEIQDNLLYISNEKEQIKKYLRESGKVSSYDGFYFVFKRKGLISERFHRQKHIDKAWKKVERVLGLIKKIPFIRHISVCNTLALNVYNKESDVDLFIITKENRLFTARFFITFLFHLLGLRRHGKKIISRFCLSFFASESSLDLGKIVQKPNDIYLAYWLKTLIPIYDPDKFIETIYSKNDYWLAQYFVMPLKPNMPKQNIQSKMAKSSINSSILKSLLEKSLDAKFGDFIEEKLKKWQIRRALIKKLKLQDSTGTIISPTMLKFHDVDRRKELYREWKRRLEKLGAS